MVTHQCPAPRCNRQVQEDRLACRTDWYRLPKDLRDRVWAAWYGGGAGSPEHSEVVREAIEWYRAND